MGRISAAQLILRSYYSKNIRMVLQSGGKVEKYFEYGKIIDNR